MVLNAAERLTKLCAGIHTLTVIALQSNNY